MEQPTNTLPQKVNKWMTKKMKTIKKNLTVKEKLEISDENAKILCVQNGGLGNNVSQEELLPLFSDFGEIEGIVMVPLKQYCFVCFADVSSASKALNHLNGYLLREGKDPTQNVTLYLFYVQKVPSSVMPSHEKPPGLHIVENFVTEELEQALIKFVNMDNSEIDGGQDLGVMKHRQVKHFGFEFKYGINDVDVNDPLPDGIPEMCHEFLSRAKDQRLMNHFPDQLTVNQYKPGQGIPSHVDTVDAFEDGIISLSLGSHVVMDFRHPDGRHLCVFLPRRSLLVMSGDARYVWSHGITPRKSDIVEAPSGCGLTLQHREKRTSFTFRKVVMNREKDKMENFVDSRILPQNDEEAVALEKQHVHKVYNDIADHFSGTRYKPWPRVVDFLMEQPPLSLLADVGCGNGKCLGVNKDLFEIGSDFSSNLASICHSRGNETCVADVTSLPFRSSSFDVVLCIAVIHHMATKERRLKAVIEVVRILRPCGKALIYVWAMEQEQNKTQSKYIKSKRQKKLQEMADGSCDVADSKVETNDYCEKTMLKTGDGGDNRNEEYLEKDLSEKCDISNTKLQKCDTSEFPATTSTSVYHRSPSQPGFIRSSECGAAKPISIKHPCKMSTVKKEEEVKLGDGTCEIQQHKENDGFNENLASLSGMVKDHESEHFNSPSTSNSCPKKLHVHINRTQFKEQDMLVPWQLKCKGAEKCEKPANESEGKPDIFHRFYHVFRQGELEAVCKKVPGCVLRKSYYDQGNWCVVLEKL